LRLLLLLTAILCVFLTGQPGVSFAADGLPPHSRVDFYPGRARVVFEVEAAETVKFTLPGTFESSTLRALPARGQKITSFEVAAGDIPGWIPGRLEDLRKSIKEKEEVIAHLTARQASIKQAFGHLSAPLPKELKGADMAEYVETARSLREKLETDLISIAVDLAEAKNDLQGMNKTYSSLMPKNFSNAASITAAVEGGEKLLVEAWTSAADWDAFYKMNLDSESGTITASLYAAARQMTGIDLGGELYFHTTMPSTKVSLPKLGPSIADFEEKYVAPTRSRAFDDARMPELGAAPAPSESAPPQVDRTMTDMSAKASGSLSGDNRKTEFLLGEFEMKSELSIVAVPHLSEEAWITSVVKNLPINLLPGPAELSVDGALSAKTSLRELGEGNELTLAFGKIPLVKSVREKIVPKSGSSWWSGDGKKEDGYTIEVTNGLDKEISVVLKDRIPVSAQEKITIETEKIEPKPATHEKNGLLSWELTLAPGEMKKIEVIYKMQYPSDERVIFR
jgi:uncharacterized protein (TIGR02231 family)